VSHRLNPLIRQPGDVLLKGAVDEAVVRPGALDEDALAHGFEEGDEVQGQQPVIMVR